MPNSRLMLDIGFVSLKHPSVHIKQQLHRFARSRWALTTVVTTLIILVISVLLASVVTYFAINVTSTRTQEESLALTKQHVWFDSSSGKAQAAIMIINAGGRDVVIGKLTVRGQTCAWSKVFFALASDSISGDLAYNYTLVDGGSISVGGSSREFKQATIDLTLQSGKTLIIYLSNPDSISVNDIGLTVSVNIFTSQSMYNEETNVQGTGGTTSIVGQVSPTSSPTTSPSSSPSPSVEIVYATAWFVYTKIDVLMVIRNNGASAETFDLADVIGNAEPCTTDSGSRLFACDGVTTVNRNLPNEDPSIGGTVTIQSYILWSQPSGFTLDSGETAIVYFRGVYPANMADFGFGDTATVGIHFTGGSEVTETVTVKLTTI
jgi:hypothetical protein